MALLSVYGLLSSESFHIARCCAEDLHQKFADKFKEPVVKFMLECDWTDFVDRKKIEIKGDTWAYTDTVMCFIDESQIGNHKDLLQWAQDEFSYEDFRPESLYSAMATEVYQDYFRNSDHRFAYMNIGIDSIPAGQLVFELMADTCPKTCENFMALCTGEKGSLSSGLNLTYENSVIHRIVPNGWIQGGDILHGRGDGGECIHGGTFEDENFAIPHSSRGILGMANRGRHTNGSQFYITLQPTPWMDCKYVAFGRLVEGTDLLKKLEDTATINERPKFECRISGCGEFIPAD